jgi:hypothetical protein
MQAAADVPNAESSGGFGPTTWPGTSCALIRIPAVMFEHCWK